MKLSKKILLEAAKNAEQQNRMQELAGLKKTGCPAEHLSKENQKIFMEGLLDGSPIQLNEKQTGKVSYVCVKKQQPNSATACEEGCPPCPDGCDCKKITEPDPPKKGISDPDPRGIGEDVIQWEFEGCAQNLDISWFIYLTWDTCEGSKCQDCYDGGCSCVERIADSTIDPFTTELPHDIEPAKTGLGGGDPVSTDPFDI